MNKITEAKKWAYAHDPTKEVEVKVFKDGKVISEGDEWLKYHSLDGTCPASTGKFDLVPLQEPQCMPDLTNQHLADRLREPLPLAQFLEEAARRLELRDDAK